MLTTDTAAEPSLEADQGHEAYPPLMRTTAPGLRPKPLQVRSRMNLVSATILLALSGLQGPDTDASPAGSAAEPSQEAHPGHSAVSTADACNGARAPAQAARAAPPGSPASGPHHPGWRALACGRCPSSPLPVSALSEGKVCPAKGLYSKCIDAVP